jgi:hypothetical protein
MLRPYNARRREAALKHDLTQNHGPTEGNARIWAGYGEKIGLNAGAVEYCGCEGTTMGVVGSPRLHKDSRKFSRAKAKLPIRTGENRA